MKRISVTCLAVLIVGIGTLYAEENVTRKQTETSLDSIDIIVTYDIEFKPMAFYYEVDPYLPVKVLLEGSGFILDPQLGVNVEKTISRSAFMADPDYLRTPVVVSDVYDFDKECYRLDVARYSQKGIATWEIQILDMAGRSFRTLEGKGSLPETVEWDGRGKDGRVMSVGDVYTYNVRLRTKNDGTIRKGGGTIDITGIAYGNVVEIKETEMDVSNIYGEVSRKVADYYRIVTNRFKEGGFSQLIITSSDIDFAEAARDYLAPRLLNVPIEVREDPKYPRVQFVFH
ncbi:hypothetical protein GF359_08870 [candidate division WOR-3 bacterium]|uniref:Uncharacterized protein n=1 Tax=candidate division WOR-3 bacterium TaxID=2052148 RepID=A0A9D5KAM7_UNCW3|nr:hypothetical protein [candidate division WOR-3 bacterium]MBD3365312.1 hypothetical protein [candidate division WOR-3 bacterium]